MCLSEKHRLQVIRRADFDDGKTAVKNVILEDGIVCLDPDGRSQFLDLMRKRRQDACFYTFDLLWLDGKDLCGWAARQGRTGFLYAEHVLIKDKDLYRVICREDIEEIVARHKLAPYVTSPATWFKVLNRNYTHKHGRREKFESFQAAGSLRIGQSCKDFSH